LPCVCLQTVCCVGGRLWCCEDDKSTDQGPDLQNILRLSYDNAKVTNYDRLTTYV